MGGASKQRRGLEQRSRYGRSWILSLVALLLSTWPVPLNAEQETTKTADYVVAPLKLGNQNQLVVETKVNGKPGIFVVDTGAPLSCLNEERAAYFGLKPFLGNKRIPPTVVANGRLHRVAQVSSWRLGGVEIQDIPVILIDIDEVERRPDAANGSSSPQIDGIIGLDLLCALGALVDYSGGDLYLKTNFENNSDRKKAFEKAMLRGGWSSVPMQMRKGHFIVESTVNGNRALFIVDTGAPVSVVDREFCKKAKLPMSAKTLSAKGLNFSDHTSGVTMDSRVAIGAVQAGKWPLVVFDLSRLLRSSNNEKPQEVGLLGSHTLLANAAVIDCENQRLYLRGAK